MTDRYKCEKGCLNMNFFETKMGHIFFEASVPKLIHAIDRLADAVEKMNVAEGGNAGKNEAEREAYHRNKMFGRLMDFAKMEDVDSEVSLNQLHALWVAYCIHADYEVNTAPYDNDMMELWDVLSENKTNPFANFDAFDNYMCVDLV